MYESLRACECEAGTRAAGEAKTPELGRLEAPGVGDEGEALANGLLRRDTEPGALKGILGRKHQQLGCDALGCCRGGARIKDWQSWVPDKGKGLSLRSARWREKRGRGTRVSWVVMGKIEKATGAKTSGSWEFH